MCVRLCKHFLKIDLGFVLLMAHKFARLNVYRIYGPQTARHKVHRLYRPIIRANGFQTSIKIKAQQIYTLNPTNLTTIQAQKSLFLNTYYINVFNFDHHKHRPWPVKLCEHLSLNYLCNLRIKNVWASHRTSLRTASPEGYVNLTAQNLRIWSPKSLWCWSLKQKRILNAPKFIRL